MSETVKYLFTNENVPDNQVVFRSTVNSFGLDHTTDKDLYSFYTKFSQGAYIDTGLLPVDGSGILSIRSALNHTQVAYQHAPGKYYINWGAYEGQADATKYLVAQPYRIVIIDFLNGNILGARTFYSPYPITHPQAQLYHVNLPNINCRGYRKNGVGWICLYHTEDLTSYPFNEKLIKALERCSGVETYNDANMSETDGTRFYKEHRFDYSYLYDPRKWEEKTENEGVDWTLDPDLWIPVLVKNWDDQGSHDYEGQPLTFADSLFGNYRAYYTDDLVPKPVNAIARTDSELSYQKIFTYFKQCFVGSQEPNNFSRIDTFNMSTEIKQNLATKKFVQPQYEEEDDEDEQVISVTCNDCEYTTTYNEVSEDFPEEFTILDNSYVVCNSCIESDYFETEEGIFIKLDSKEFEDFAQEMQKKSSGCVLCWEHSYVTKEPTFYFYAEELNQSLDSKVSYSLPNSYSVLTKISSNRYSAVKLLEIHKYFKENFDKIGLPTYYHPILGEKNPVIFSQVHYNLIKQHAHNPNIESAYFLTHSFFVQHFCAKCVSEKFTFADDNQYIDEFLKLERKVEEILEIAFNTEDFNTLDNLTLKRIHSIIYTSSVYFHTNIEFKGCVYSSLGAFITAISELQQENLTDTAVF